MKLEKASEVYFAHMEVSIEDSLFNAPLDVHYTIEDDEGYIVGVNYAVFIGNQDITDWIDVDEMTEVIINHAEEMDSIAYAEHRLEQMEYA